MIDFIDRNGEYRKGTILRQYEAWEGDVRYIILDEINNREYRCVKVDGEYRELVV